MIQRIQTIYLFIAAIILPLLLWVPYAAFSGATGSAWQTLLSSEIKRQDGSTLVSDMSLLQLVSLIFAATVVLGLLVTIFLYKKRKTQLALTYTMILGLLAILGLFGLEIFQLSDAYQGDGLTFEPASSLGLFIPVLSIVFAWLAAKNIKKDEALVRSADRIR